ncbi:MAG: peptidylprolyl isomerase [Oscillospiraceae bacterium]|nr:peptidylprolyl isomerase [Oscillospiraceae bacterium]
MKKFVFILLIVCLILGVAVGYVVAKNGANGSGEPVSLTDPEGASAAEPDAVVTDPATSEPIAVRKLDYEAIYALHEPDEVVGSVNGSDVSWDEYFYWLYSEGLQIEQELEELAYYGQKLDWDEKLSSDSDLTLEGYLLALTADDVVPLHVVEAVAEENGVALTAENEEQLRALLQQRIEASGVEDEEAFDAMLEREMIPRAVLDRLDRANYLYQNSFIALYGADGEKVPEETALAYLRDNGYLCAAHILFATFDLETYERLDEAAIAEKRSQAEAAAAELRAIEDPAARAQRFAELKEQYCDDKDGARLFPDGYLFSAGSGAMDEEFEAGVKALKENEVSEPVETVYGYHVILRLPLDADMTMQYSEADTPLSARAVYANEQFNAMLDGRLEQSAFEPRDGFSLDLLQYLK